MQQIPPLLPGPRLELLVRSTCASFSPKVHLRSIWSEHEEQAGVLSGRLALTEPQAADAWFPRSQAPQSAGFTERQRSTELND